MTTRARVSLGTCAALLCGSVALWVSIGALTIANDAMRARMGLLPSIGWLALFVGAALLVVFVARPRSGRVAVAALSLLSILPWIPGRVPDAVFVWAGHVRLWLWIAIAAAFAAPARRRLIPAPLLRAAADPRRAPWLAATLAASLYLVGAWFVSPRLPGGDEPHYLVIAQSLLEDHDLRIENNHQQQDYRAYFPGTLKPDYLRRGLDGQIYSVHAPGLPALIAPVFALFGYPGVIAFLAVVSGWATALAWIAAWRVTDDAAASWFGWAAIALSVPFFFQSFVVFPDAPGAAIVMIGVLTMMAGARASERSLLGTGAALAFLPWLHTRFALIAAVLGVLVVARNIGAPARVRRLVAFLVIPALGAAAWFWFFYAIYGTPNPAAPYGAYTQTSLANIPRGLTGLLFDQQFGLLLNAPIYMCAGAGLLVMLRRQSRLTLELLFVIVPYALAAVAYQMWWAGASSPARFLVAVVLPLAIPAGMWFASASRGARIVGLGALLLSGLITGTLVGVDRGRLLYNVRQEEAARWLAWISPLVNVMTGMPSFFQDPAKVLGLAAIWIVACGATVWVGVTLGRSKLPAQAVALGVGATAAVSAMVALTIVWHLNGAQPLTPAEGSVELLRQYDRGSFALRYSPLHRFPIDDLPALLVLDSRTGAPTQPGQPLLFVARPPAATYEIEAAVSGSQAMRITATTDREFGPQWSWDLKGVAGVWRQTLTLPLAVGGLAVDASADTNRALDSIAIHAVRVARGRDLLASDEPVHATRYGPAVVFLLDGHAYTEAGGTWVVGGGFGTFVLSPDPGTPIRLFVRNAPVRNQVTLESAAWRQDLTLEPREERMFDVPFSPGTHAALLRVTTSAGARPSDLDPKSEDRRLLGCWIETR